MIKNNILSNIKGLIIILVIITFYNGIGYTLAFLYQLLKLFNTIFLQLYSNSVLSMLFKHHVVFPIVGIILVAIGSPKGREGRLIGKILYYVIGLGIAFLLNYLSNFIF